MTPKELKYVYNKFMEWWKQLPNYYPKVKHYFPKINMRILMFHDAMIERGQIKPIEKPRQPELIEN